MLKAKSPFHNEQWMFQMSRSRHLLADDSHLGNAYVLRKMKLGCPRCLRIFLRRPQFQEFRPDKVLSLLHKGPPGRLVPAATASMSLNSPRRILRLLHKSPPRRLISGVTVSKTLYSPLGLRLWFEFRPPTSNDECRAYLSSSVLGSQ